MVRKKADLRFEIDSVKKNTPRDEYGDFKDGSVLEELLSPGALHLLKQDQMKAMKESQRKERAKKAEAMARYFLSQENMREDLSAGDFDVRDAVAAQKRLIDKQDIKRYKRSIEDMDDMEHYGGERFGAEYKKKRDDRRAAAKPKKNIRRYKNNTYEEGK